jgi:hypothetical protein
LTFAEKLQGFPQYIGQEVRYKFGLSPDELSNYGSNGVPCFVDLQFYCVDKLGHLALRINLIGECWSILDRARDDVSLQLQFDPTSLDLFVQELIVLAKTRTGKATLKGNLAVRGGYY